MDKDPNARKKPLYLLLAVVIAAAIWFYVDQFGNNGSPFQAEMLIKGIPIEFTGEDALADRGLFILDEGTTSSVDITFEGARLLVIQLNRSRVRLTADLSTVTSPGIQTVRYNISYLNERLQPSFTANQQFSRLTTRRSTDSTTINVSRLASKTVDVRCELVGTVGDGYSAGKPELSQETVEVQGLEETISEISYAKVVLDIGDAAESSASGQLAVQFYSASNELVESDDLYPSVEYIQVYMPVSVTKELELVVDITDAAGVRLGSVTREIKPKSISVTGEASLLKDVDSLTLGAVNLPDLVGTEQTIHTFYYPVHVPDGCENLSGVTQAVLTLVLKDLRVREVSTSRFVVSSELSDGRTVEMVTESLPVTIFGTAEDVEDVTGQDIIVRPDLSDYTSAAGVYTVPVAVTVRTAGDVGVKGSYQVQVNIREAEAAPEPAPPAAGDAEETEPEASPADSGTDGALSPDSGGMVGVDAAAPVS